MRVGPESYCWQDIASAGVPRGGQFGRPSAMAKRLRRHGMYLAWSWTWKCFDVYTRARSGKLTMQWRCWKQGRPLPLTDEFVDLMIYLKRDMVAHRSNESMAKFFNQQQAELKYEQMVEQRKYTEMMRNDVLHATDLATGARTPATSIIVPGFAGMN